MSAANADDLRVMSLAEPRWGQFDPHDQKVGPVDYPDDLSGLVEWLRTYTEGGLETAGGSVGLSICHMQGDPTDWLFDKTNEETEIMVLFEGTAEGRLRDGTTVQAEGPAVVLAPRGLTYSWRYTSAYRGVYVIIW